VSVTESEVCVRTKGLLFDMDGVLVSSIGAVERCWQQWCVMYGIANADAFDVPHGKRAVDIVRMLKPQFDEAQVAEGLRVIEDLEIADTAGLTVLPGAKALLERLPPERWANRNLGDRATDAGSAGGGGTARAGAPDLRRHGGAGQARSRAVSPGRSVAGPYTQGVRCS